MEESKVLNVSIGSPINTTTSNVVNDPILDRLSDEPLVCQPTKKEEKEARSFLKNIQNYLQSEKFINDCNERAKQTGESPKKVAKTYIGKVAGIIGDGLGMVVDTINIGAVGLIELIGSLLTKAINLICSIVRGIVRAVTFNRTNHVAVV